MTIFKLVRDSAGVSQVEQTLQDLAKKGMSPSQHQNNYQDLAKYVAQAFDYLKETGVPNPPHLLFVTPNLHDKNKLVSFQILKELKTTPLLEFRVNGKPEAFRAIFFCAKNDDGEQVLYFTRALLKSTKNPPELQQAIHETELIYNDFQSHPSKYI